MTDATSAKPLKSPAQQTPDTRSSSRSAWYWTAFIACFFGLQALLWTTALTLVQKYPMRPVQSLSDNSAEVENASRRDTNSASENAGETEVTK